jgi:hypothetical protein
MIATINLSYANANHAAAVEALAATWSERNINCNGMSFVVEIGDFDSVINGVDTGDAILDACLAHELFGLLDQLAQPTTPPSPMAEKR